MSFIFTLDMEFLPICFFFLYTYLILGHRPKPTDLISCQLTFIHIMMILSEGDNLLANILESLKFGNDVKCKTTFYKNRVMKELSICTTCLLSVFQAITISPSTSFMAKFKHKLKKIHDLFFLLFLIFQFVIQH